MSEILTPELTEDGCRNCGEPRTGPFCAACGECHETNEIASMAEISSEFLSEFLQFDSKVFRTLKSLLFRPGQLTTAYVEGHRSHYVRPVKLYLVLSAIYFLSFKFFDPMKIRISFGEDANSEESQFWQGMIDGMKSSMSPEALSQQLQEFFLSSLSIFTLIMIPLIALATHLFFYKSRPHYQEHLILTVHFTCATFVFGVVLIPLTALNIGAYGLIFSVWSYAYHFRMLKNHYGESLGATWLKFLGLLAVQAMLQIALLIGIAVFVAIYVLLGVT